MLKKFSQKRDGVATHHFLANSLIAMQLKSYLFVQECAPILVVGLATRVLEHVHALEVVTEAEEEGKVVATHHVHGEGAGDGGPWGGHVSEVEWQRHPTEQEHARRERLEDAVRHQQRGHRGVVGAKDHIV